MARRAPCCTTCLCEAVSGGSAIYSDCGGTAWCSSRPSASSSIKGASGAGCCKMIGTGPVGRPGLAVTIGVCPCAAMAACGSRDRMASTIFPRIRSCIGSPAPSKDRSKTGSTGACTGSGPTPRFSTRAKSDLGCGCGGEASPTGAFGTFVLALITDATRSVSLCNKGSIFG